MTTNTKDTKLKRQAQLARERFAVEGPPDAPSLPLSHDEIEDARNARGLTGACGFYARSLALRQWDLQEHPSFRDFTRGLMASDTGSWKIEQDAQLQQRFPPRRLEGMGPDLHWRPPGEHAQFMASYNRHQAGLAA
jgi:hypothetical protein